MQYDGWRGNNSLQWHTHSKQSIVQLKCRKQRADYLVYLNQKDWSVSSTHQWQYSVQRSQYPLFNASLIRSELRSSNVTISLLFILSLSSSLSSPFCHFFFLS